MVGDIKSIVVIQSLPKDDKKTGKELFDDTIKMHIDYKQPTRIKMTYQFHDVEGKISFVEMLRFYGINSQYIIGGIVIYLEMHGASDKRGLILRDGSFISWEEIVDLLRVININTKNNLYITMATCYGRYLFEGAHSHKKSPYSGYISASKEVMAKEIIDDFTIIFETLIASGNLVYSYLELEKNGSNFYYMDSKRTFEVNFEAFKNNPNFKKQVLDSATNTVMERGGEIADEEMSNFIYDAALSQAYQEQIKKFEFKIIFKINLYYSFLN